MEIADAQDLAARVRTLAPVAALVAALRRSDAEVYLVGGSVRDAILGRALVDVDLAVDGESRRLAEMLGAPETVETRFGTLSVTREGLRHDIARTRRERYAHPGALPDVEPAGIDADLERRDFTVNALALGLAGSRAGRLLAAPGALGDLEAGRLAVLHDRSFVDDPTRLLRLARYAARLGFVIAPHTRELASEAIAGGALATVSGSRIGNELRLLATEPDPVAAFAAAAALGLPWSIDAPLARRALDALPSDGRCDLLVLACVFAAQSPAGLVPELDRLGFTAADRAAIVEAATGAPDLARRVAGTNSGAEIARAVGSAGVATAALALALGPPEAPRRWLQELRHLRLQMTGADLIDSGIPEGPAVGRALQAARDAMYDGAAPDRDAQLQVALRAAR